MIIDHIKNAPVYFGVDPAIEEALRFLMNYDGPVDQRDVIQVSERVLVKICPYTTKDESKCVFEAHKRYADIHYMVRGREIMAYASVEDMRVTSEDEEADLILLEGKATKVPLNEGNFLIAFPQDAHLCAMMMDVPEACCKLVAKVLCGKDVTADELMAGILLDEPFYLGGGGVTFSGGEPMMQRNFLDEMIDRCRADSTGKRNRFGSVRVRKYRAVADRI